MSIQKITVQSAVPKTLIMRHESLGISSVFLVSLQKDKRKLVCVSTIRQVIVIEMLKILKRVETYCHNKRVVTAHKMLVKATETFAKLEQEYAKKIAELKQYTE